MRRKLVTFLNKILPKLNHVIVQGYPNLESGAVEVANKICDGYDILVFFPVSKSSVDYSKLGLLNSKVIIIDKSSFYLQWKYLTARYLFFTHGSQLNTFSKRQVSVNLWHGILYKKVGTLLGQRGIPASFTVSTSELTQKMFSTVFDVVNSTVLVTGYPRNDVMINTKTKKQIVKNKISKEFSAFDKIIIWLPTYRKSNIGVDRRDGLEVGNPFYIENFQVDKFNQILKDNNTLCIVKPHPMAPSYCNQVSLDNLMFIDDKWISDRGITLYHLVGCTDILISDVSSVIIDYMLLDQPIICMSSDFDEYKRTRGFYFEDIENWIPCAILKEENDFFDYVNNLLTTGVDPFAQKRKRLKDIFFTYQDANATERLLKDVFDN